MSVTAKQVKELREKTGAGMMDCKKALVEENGDFEAAIDWLRQKGLSAAAKKSGRVAAEGLVGLAVKGNKGAMVELNSETDFVAKNDKFQDLVKGVVEVVMGSSDLSNDAILATKYPGSGETVKEAITSAVAVIGENMNLRRVTEIEVKKGVVGKYMHNAAAEGLGKIGVLVGIESEGDEAKLQDLAKKICMHIAASSPEALSSDSLDSALIEREKAIFLEQAKDSGKPDNIIEKMVEGRIKKYFGEVVLLLQPFVMDNKQSVADVIAAAEKEIGSKIEITNFERFELGDGIEQEEKDFAAEVASMR